MRKQNIASDRRGPEAGDGFFHAVSLSGGKDSTCLLLLMIERGLPIDAVIWADTGMEFPEMYAHIVRVDEHLYRERGLCIPPNTRFSASFRNGGNAQGRRPVCRMCCNGWPVPRRKIPRRKGKCHAQRTAFLSALVFPPLLAYARPLSVLPVPPGYLPRRACPACPVRSAGRLRAFLLPSGCPIQFPAASPWTVCNAPGVVVSALAPGRVRRAGCFSLRPAAGGGACGFRSLAAFIEISPVLW